MAIVVLFSVGSLIFVTGIATPALSDIREANNLLRSKQSFYVSEGSVEDVVYRLVHAGTVGTTETLTIDGVSAVTTISDITGGKSVVAEGSSVDLVRTSQINVLEGIGASFFYGLQTGTGGIFMENNSEVLGNVYANGPVTATSDNLITGEVVSAGPAGLIDGIHATGTAYANIIQDSQVDGDAYYQTISNTIVDGTEYPGSTDQVTTSMPVTDAMVVLWELEAEAGGVISSPCPYVIDSDRTIGPIKIECDLHIDKNSTDVTLTGPVWVVGDVLTTSGPTIKIDSSAGKKSYPIIADNPADRLTSSQISLENSSVFEGSGTPGSYVVMLSQNESAENGGSEIAINIKNSATGDLLVYAAHGEILLQNNIELKEVTAFKVHLKNFASVVYETGLSSLLFSSGPGGGFEIDFWREVE